MGFKDKYLSIRLAEEDRARIIERAHQRRKSVADYLIELERQFGTDASVVTAKENK